MKRFYNGILNTQWVQILLSIGTLIFGLLIQPLLQNVTSPLFNKTEHLLLAGIILTSFLMIVAANTFLILLAKNHKDFDSIQDELKSISKRMGLTVEFLSDKGVKSKQDAYSVVRNLAEYAKYELLILDHRPSLTSDRFYDQTPPESKSRQFYYDILSSKALSKTENGDYFRYKRIVQLDEGPTYIWDTNVNKDQLFTEHCKKIVDFRKSSTKAVSSISTSRVFFPKSSIIIADARKVLIEIAIVGPDGKTKVAGDLVFDDPEGKLGRPLKQLFDHIDGQSTLITEVK